MFFWLGMSEAGHWLSILNPKPASTWQFLVTTVPQTLTVSGLLLSTLSLYSTQLCHLHAWLQMSLLVGSSLLSRLPSLPCSRHTALTWFHDYAKLQHRTPMSCGPEASSIGGPFSPSSLSFSEGCGCTVPPILFPIAM